LSSSYLRLFEVKKDWLFGPVPCNYFLFTNNFLKPMKKEKSNLSPLFPPEVELILATHKVLRLTLSKKAFDITGTKEKPFELRSLSVWILSRLYSKNPLGSRSIPRVYDYVLFVNGYSHNSPFKLVEFVMFKQFSSSISKTFSNGLRFDCKRGDVYIGLGNVIFQSNTLK
jgi:hypothetical protein